MSWPPTGKIWVNDTDLAVYKMAVAPPKGFLSAPGVTGQSVAIAGRAGHLRTSGERLYGPRRFTVAGVIRTTSDTEAETLWGQALRLLSEEDLEIWFGWWPDRIAHAQYEGVEWIEVAGMQHAAQFLLTFVMDNPHKYSRLPDIYTLPYSGEAALTLGTAPSDVHLTLIGTGHTHPTVYYKDAQGQIRGDVRFDFPPPGGLPVGQFIQYDGTYQVSRRYYLSAGALVYDVPELTATHLFVADPADGDGTQGPSIEAVNCAVHVSLWKSWL